MRVFLRLLIPIVGLMLIFAPLGSPVRAAGKATWIPTPSIWDLQADDFDLAWETEVYASCTAFTIIIGSSLDRFPQEFNGYYNYAFKKVAWHLEGIFDQGGNAVALADGQDTLVAEFLAEEHDGLPHDGDGLLLERIVKQKTFTYAEPVLSGKRLWAALRIDYTYDDLATAEDDTLTTKTFDITELGDFNDPFDFARASGVEYNEAGNRSFFCDSGEARNAPTVSLTGNVITPETSGSSSYVFHLVLSEPTDRPVEVEIGVEIFEGLEEHGVPIPIFRKPACVGRSGSSVYACPGRREQFNGYIDYTTAIIPAGEINTTFKVNFGGNTLPEEFVPFADSATIETASGAKIGERASVQFFRIDDDGCIGGLPPDEQQPCIVNMEVPFDTVQIPKSFRFYVTSDAVQADDGLLVFPENDGTATLTVHLNHQNYTSSNITVQYYTVMGSADATDFGHIPEESAGTLTFAPGATSQTIDIALTNDTLGEMREYFKLVLTNPNGAIVLSPSPFEFTFWIEDDELTTELLTNGGFETVGLTPKAADKWNGDATNRARRRCNAVNVPGTEDAIRSRYGSCAYEFKPGLYQIRQVIKDPAVLADITQGNTVTLSAWFEPKNLTKGAKVQAQIRFNGSPRQTLAIKPPKGTHAYSQRTKTSDILTDAPVRKIIVIVTKGGSAGKLRVDGLRLTLTKPGSANLALPLPLPEAVSPDGAQRGVN